MFNTAFRYLGIDAAYVRLAASKAEEVVALAREINIAGLNITSPFKREILRYLDDVEGDARKIGSVNVVVRSGERLVGYNTDVAGVLEALRGSGFDPSGHKAAVLGAGGAGLAACLALVSAGANVVLINRTFDKGRAAAGAHRVHCPASRPGERRPQRGSPSHLRRFFRGPSYRAFRPPAHSGGARR